MRLRRAPAGVLLTCPMLALVVACGTTVPQAARQQATTSGALDGGASAPTGPFSTAPSTVGEAPAVVSAGAGALPPASGPPTGMPTSLPSMPTTKPAGPVSVGFLTTDYSKAAVAAGLGDNANIVSDPQVAFRALVGALNKKGGLAGRQVQPVYFTIDAQQDRQTQFQAACAAFTQDHHVAVVVSFETQLDTLSSCLGRHHVAQFDTNEWQRTQFPLNPGYVMANGLSMDRQVAAVFDQAVASGWLTSKHHLGVLTDGCLINVQAYQRTLLPRAKALGVSIERFDASACGSAQDAVRGVQQAALKFHSDGVNRVMYIAEGGEAVANVLMSQNADKQQWYPGYLLSSGAQLANFGGYLPPGQLPNMHGTGWSPEFFDSVTWTHQPAAQKAVQGECLALLASGGYRPTRTVDRYLGLGSCDTVFLLRAALARSGFSLGSSSLQAAVEGLGTSYVSTTTPLGRTRFGTGRQDGALLAATFSYHHDCSCFRYDTAFRQV